MATYKVSELLEQITRIANDDYECVDLELLDGDTDLPESLSFVATKAPSSRIDYGVITSFVD